MKTTFKKNIAALTAIALFAPWASAQYTDQALDVIAGEITGGDNTLNTLVEDINIANAAQDTATNAQITVLSAATTTNNANIGINSTNIGNNSTNIGNNATAITTNSTLDQAFATAADTAQSTALTTASNAYADLAEADAITAATAADTAVTTAANAFATAADTAQSTALTTASNAYADQAEADAITAATAADTVNSTADRAFATNADTAVTTAAQNYTDALATGAVTDNTNAIARIDSYDTHAQNVLDLGGLVPGAANPLPAQIVTVLDKINDYKAIEEVSNAAFLADIATRETNIAGVETSITTLQQNALDDAATIQATLAANPFADVTAAQAALAAVEANIVTAQGFLATQNAELLVEKSNLSTSDTKIALYTGAIETSIQGALDDIALANADLTKAVTDYTNVNSAGGLEGIIKAIDDVQSGDQSTVISAIVAAEATFATGGGTIAEIQTLVQAVDTNLRVLPTITDDGKIEAIQNVTDGAYERVAIADNATEINTNATAIAAETTRATAAELVNAGDIAAETTRATAAELVNAGDIAAETARATAAEGVNAGGIAVNAGDIQTLNDTVFSSALGAGEVGIAGVVVSTTNAAGDEIIKLGSNTFTFNNTTDTISTSSGVINLDADVAITGDLEVAGDVFVGGHSIGLQSQINTNRQDIDRNARGIAMVAALQHTTVLPGMTHALDLSAAHFEGETGMALNYARRISENVQINFGAAATSDFDESVIKAGLGIQW